MSRGLWGVGVGHGTLDVDGKQVLEGGGGAWGAGCGTPHCTFCIQCPTSRVSMLCVPRPTSCNHVPSRLHMAQMQCSANINQRTRIQTVLLWLGFPSNCNCSKAARSLRQHNHLSSAES